MKTLRMVAVVFLSLPVWLQAEPIASEEQMHEWTEPHPQLILRNLDKYVDYMRDGKVVFRVIRRTTNVKMKPTDPESLVETRLIEFVCEDKVVASVNYTDDGHTSSTVQTAEGVFFSANEGKLPGQSKWELAFHVCIPKHNYYEYVEITNKEVIAQSESDEAFAQRKAAFIKMAEKGYIRTLAEENTR